MSPVPRPDHRRSDPGGADLRTATTATTAGTARTERHGAHRSGRSAGLRHVLTHLITPLLMCVGMGLAYLGAFADPAPHHLPVAIVGSGQSAQLLAQSINDKAGGDLEVRTVGDRSAAVEQLRHQ